MPESNCTNNPVTALCLSQSKWSSRNGGSSSLTTVPMALDCIRRLPAMAKTTTRKPRDTTPISKETSLQQQWEHMRAFHSSILLWPFEEWKCKNWMEGDSPLIWTMLHSPSAEVRLQTYTWTGHLENYMPWSDGQTDATVRPSIVSQARWNIRKSTIPQARVNPSQGPMHTNQAIPEKSTSMSPLDSQQFSIPKIPGPLFRALPTQQLAPDLKRKGLLPKNPPSSAARVPNTTLPSTVPSSHLIGCKSTSLVLMAIRIYLFLVQQPSKPGPAAPHTMTPVLQHWSNSHPHQVCMMKIQQSGFRWTVAIIQRLWNTAWDLIAHRNEDSPV